MLAALVIAIGLIELKNVPEMHRAIASIISLAIAFLASALYWLLAKASHVEQSVLLYVSKACVFLIPLPLAILFLTLHGSPTGSN